MTQPQTGSPLLSISAIADTFGLAEATVRTYNGQAAQRRRAGTARAHDFPAPVDRIGNSPLFDPAAVRDWFDHRPGRGAGGGRPRKRTTQTDGALAETTSDPTRQGQRNA